MDLNISMRCFDTRVGHRCCTRVLLLGERGLILLYCIHHLEAPPLTLSVVAVPLYTRVGAKLSVRPLFLFRPNELYTRMPSVRVCSVCVNCP